MVTKMDMPQTPKNKSPASSFVENSSNHATPKPRNNDSSSLQTRSQMLQLAKKKLAKYQRQKTPQKSAEIPFQAEIGNQSRNLENRNGISSDNLSINSLDQSPNLPHKTEISKPEHVGFASDLFADSANNDSLFPDTSSQISSNNQNAFEVLMVEKNSLVQKNEEVNRRLSIVSDQLAKEEEQTASLTAENHDLRKKSANMVDIYGRMQVDNDCLSRENRELRDSIEKLEIRLKELHEKSQVQSAELDAFKSNIAYQIPSEVNSVDYLQLKSKLAEADSMVESLRMTIDQKNEKIDRMAIELSGIDADLQSTRADMAEEEKAHFEELNSKNLYISKLEDELASLKTHLENSYENPPQVTNETSEFQQQIAIISDKNASLVKEKDKLTNDNDRLMSQIAELEKMISSVEAEKGELNERITKMKNQLNESDEQNLDLLGQLEEARGRIVEVMNEKVKWTNDLDDAVVEHRRQSKQVEDLKKSLQELNKDTSGSFDGSNEIDELNRINGELKQQISELQSKVASIELHSEKVQQLNDRLMMEAETIPDYIERYHQERQILRTKSSEKDKVIKHMAYEYQTIVQSLKQIKNHLDDHPLGDNSNLDNSNESRTSTIVEQILQSIELTILLIREARELAIAMGDSNPNSPGFNDESGFNYRNIPPPASGKAIHFISGQEVLGSEFYV